jgi:hypothetical protein
MGDTKIFDGLESQARELLAATVGLLGLARLDDDLFRADLACRDRFGRPIDFFAVRHGRQVDLEFDLAGDDLEVIAAVVKRELAAFKGNRLAKSVTLTRDASLCASCHVKNFARLLWLLLELRLRVEGALAALERPPGRVVNRWKQAKAK